MWSSASANMVASQQIAQVQACGACGPGLSPCVAELWLSVHVRSIHHKVLQSLEVNQVVVKPKDDMKK